MDLTEAKLLISKLVVAKRVERVRLEDALGRVLAEPIIADRDVPKESRSRLDGYAIIGADTDDASSSAPAVLELRNETLAAGHSSHHVRLRSGTCIRILTGAPLPRDANAVAPQEETVIQEDRIAFTRPYAPGDGVVPAGGEIRQGDPILAAGHVLSPTRLALVAALGRTDIPVFAKPRVALLATGDEVRELGQTAQGPSTFCNNRHLLAWLVRVQGGEPVSPGIACDDAKAIGAWIDTADGDYVITTGGIGRGDRDFVRSAWKTLGIETLFDGINLSPGGKSAVGMRGEKVFCALSGNPWAARVAFEELISPMLWRSLGLEPCRHPSIMAVLRGSVKKRGGVYRAVQGMLDLRSYPPGFVPAGAYKARLMNGVGDDLTYALLDSKTTEAAAGESIRVRFHDFPILALPLLGFETAGG